MKIHKYKKKLNSVILAAPLLVLGIFGATDIIKNHFSSAVSAKDFQAGRIIDDEVFYNKDTMTVQQIQAWLDKQIGTCDTQGTKPASDFGRSDLTRKQYAKQVWGIDTPFVCLNVYHENPTTKETSFEKGGGAFAGGISAAQIIYNAAQKYGINPQVLLVLLKKESSGPLTNDDWAIKRQYRYAMGYACPDSGANYSAACEDSKGGFYNQMDLAAWQLEYYKKNSDSYHLKLGWNNIQYAPDPACGTRRVNIENVATLSLYLYTPYTPNEATLANYPGTAHCGAYGNRNFFMFFNELFGSTLYEYIPEKCDSKVGEVTCVWRLIDKSTGVELLTTSLTERDALMNSGKWSYGGHAFYAYSTQVNGSIPVYRVRLPSEHLFTANTSERNSLINSGGVDEGIAFYALPASTQSNSSYPVRRFYGNGGHFFNTSSSGFSTYTNEGVAFNAPSGMASSPTPQSGKNNVYRLYKSNHFYTSNLSERDSLISKGWSYEGVLTQASVAATSTPVYRLYNNNYHLYTTSLSERNSLISSGTWKNEGISFYLSPDSPSIYRFTKSNGSSFLTSSQNEAASISNKIATFRGYIFNSNTSNRSPVYRLYNGSRHFYTISEAEMLQIVNKPWRFEGSSFYAYKTKIAGTIPVYRLYNGGRHLLTTSENERNNLLKNTTWRDEGVAFYAPANGTKPIYRLNKSYHFFTPSINERNSLIKNNWRAEGIAWYTD